MVKNTTRDTASFYNAVLHSLADEQIMSIINCTRDTAKSMNDIISETQFSRTTVHRKINSMVKNGLLVVERFMIASDGKKSKLFRSKMSGIKIKYEDNDMFVIIEENPKVSPIANMKNHIENTMALDKSEDDPDYLLAK
jgi:predicted transcriptional regulator